MLEFKTSKERDEYVKLGFKNPNLAKLLADLAEYVESKHKKPVVLTSVYRDAAQQAELYKQSVKKVMNSAHSSWEAADIRTRDFTEAEIADILAYLKGRYKNANGRNVALYHTVPGNAPHFHIALYQQA